MLRVAQQGVFEHRHRLRVEAVLRVGLGPRFGGFGEHVRIVRAQRRRAREGLARFHRLALVGERAAEQAPAVGLRRVALQFGLQPRDRVVDGPRRLAQCRIERGRRAEQRVQADGGAGDEHRERERQAALSAPQRREDAGERGDDQRGGEGEEGGHHHSCDWSSGTAARERRRTMPATSAPPASSTSAGPNHSSQVRPSTRGLYSTNSP